VVRPLAPRHSDDGGDSDDDDDAAADDDDDDDAARAARAARRARRAKRQPPPGARSRAAPRTETWRGSYFLVVVFVPPTSDATRRRPSRLAQAAPRAVRDARGPLAQPRVRGASSHAQADLQDCNFTEKPIKF